MGIISECLMVVLLCQAMSLLMADEPQSAVDQPNPDPPGELYNNEDMLENLETEDEYAARQFVENIQKRGGKKNKGNGGKKGGGGGKGKGSCNEPQAKGNRSVKQLNDDYVKWHNYLRCLHGVGTVKYDKQLEIVARDNVEMNVDKGGMEHTSNPRYGENLWAMWGTGYGAKYVTGKDPVKAWYDEMTNPGYNFNTRSPTMFSYGTGHFTQVVWAATKKIGCWTAEHPFQGMTRVFVACEYDPPGNMNIRPKDKNVANWNKNVPPLQ